MGIPKCWIIIYSSYTWNKEKSLPSTRHIQAYTMLAEWDDSQGKPKCPRHLWGWHVQRRGDRHGRGPPASPYGDTTWEQHRTAANLRWFQWGNTKNNNQNVKQLVKSRFWRYRNLPKWRFNRISPTKAEMKISTNGVTTKIWTPIQFSDLTKRKSNKNSNWLMVYIH